MGKYPISREFFPFSHLTPPICRPVIALSYLVCRPPRSLFRDPRFTVEERSIPGHGGDPIPALIITPKGLPAGGPCLIDYHGGGFVMEGAVYHYDLALAYAAQTPCKLVFVRYRLAPRYPFPIPTEDSYAAFLWVAGHAEELEIDPRRIGVVGDSAGGDLAAAVCLLARDRGAPVRPCLQMLLYPFLDGRLESESARRFTDTPMWNSRLTRRIWPLLRPRDGAPALDTAYLFPVEMDDLSGLPPAYLECAEFDSLRDDAVLYAERLEKAGVEAVLHEVKGAMHGFDIVTTAPTTRRCIDRRVAFSRKHFRLS